MGYTFAGWPDRSLLFSSPLPGEADRFQWTAGTLWDDRAAAFLTQFHERLVVDAGSPFGDEAGG
jgi:hypothetical protein